MNKIYAYCDGSQYIEWNLSKKQSRKQRIPRKKLFKANAAGFQYNSPNGVVLKTFGVQGSNIVSIEKKAIEGLLIDIMDNVGVSSNIYIYTDQLELVNVFNDIRLGQCKKGGHLGAFVKKCDNIIKESGHTYELRYVKSTSKSIKKHGVIEKNVHHILHSEVDRAVRKKMKSIKKRLGEKYNEHNITKIAG